MSELIEIDSLEAVVIIDNEIDLMSWVQPNAVQVSRQWKDLALGRPDLVLARGEAIKEMPMESVCCGAHGLSVLLVSST
jgi:7,8-dihydropterin-6-yl-methyl-4-(beta-D-ribofuranosyl)aminobenzene 5'-phosphate synthase